MQYFLKGENIGLITARSNRSETCDHFYISKDIMETKCGERTTQSSIFPLYLYTEISNQHSILDVMQRVPNLSRKIINQIEFKTSLTFTNEKETTENTFAPIDLLDYIYAVLHSPAYREKYKEFLKIDFPRVPYPTDVQEFWRLVQLGGELRQLHLLESPKVQQYITQYPEDGTNVVGKVRFELQPDGNTGKVWINEAQYFAGVPQTAWTFYIGGYQPAQKWLKDRKDRELSFEDILHYQQMIVALTETERVMGEVDDFNT